MDASVREVADAVRAVATDAVRSQGVELVDLEYRREPAGWVLRLFIEKEGGVGLEDCQRVSEVVGTLLEVEDPIPHAYTLEVSSPGLTRALGSPQDWQRAVGGRVRVVTRQPVSGQQSLTGRLLQAGTDAIRLEADAPSGPEPVEIAYDLIARARMEIDWPAPARPDRGGSGRTGRAKRKKRASRGR